MTPLADNDFAIALASIDRPTTAAGAVYSVRRVVGRTKLRERRQSLPADIPWRSGDPGQTEDRIQEQVHALLSAIRNGNARVSIADAAQSVVAAVEEASSSEFWDADWRHLAQHAAEDLLREAINAASWADSDAGLPEWVTVYTDEAGAKGWYRIPVEQATIAELRWMVEYRERQAQTLKDAAAGLRTVYERIASQAPRDDFRLGELPLKTLFLEDSS